MSSLYHMTSDQSQDWHHLAHDLQSLSQVTSESLRARVCGEWVFTLSTIYQVFHIFGANPRCR